MSDPRNVVYLTGEDGLADTLKPRLDAMGADSSYVYVLQGFLTRDQETGEATEHQVSMQDLSVLDQVLTKYKPVLLVIDPMQAYLGSNVDMHRANDVRPVLAGVARLAEKHGCAVLMIRHLGKSQADRAIYRGLGSIDFAAAARSVLLAGQDPQNPSSRAVIQTKNSLAPLGPAVGYAISNDGQFSWTGISELTAGQVLQADKYSETGSKLEEAKDFLKDNLADGPQPTNEVLKKAEDAGVSIVTIRRAKSELGIDSYKEPGRNGRWFYKLPDKGDHSDQDPETSIYFPNDHLITLPETLAGQGIEKDDQQNNMITLPKPLQDKGLKPQNKDDQQNILRETLENQDDDHLNILEVRI
ncbi:MAG: AAA family ATPase [Thermacetogeniaceae bacterium]